MYFSNSLSRKNYIPMATRFQHDHASLPGHPFIVSLSSSALPANTGDPGDPPTAIALWRQDCWLRALF